MLHPPGSRLEFLPELPYLHIRACRQLGNLVGWGAVERLGYLQISDCYSYKDLPPLQWLPSLREFKVDCCGIEVVAKPDFSQCVRLRSLEISQMESLALNSMDSSTLRFLEFLYLGDCLALTSIQGLSALHSLTTLWLEGCKALKRVPDLGCLKALTRLNMWGCDVEEISGVQKLHALTVLSLYRCGSLKTLPWLVHLNALRV